MTPSRFAPWLVAFVALALAVPAVFALPITPRPEAIPEVLPDALRVPAAEPAAPHGGHDAHDEDADEAVGADAAHGGHSSTAATEEGAHHSHARERTPWPAAAGEVPASGEGLVEVASLEIRYELDTEEREALGDAISGTGTLADPFVIEGVHVTRELELRDTHEYFVIRNSYVEGTLRLNWNDDRVHAHHNWVRDLRVNENIERVGESTGGLIEMNHFGIVGQIRHFDGVFRDNVVGPAPAGAFDALIEDSGAIVPVFGETRAINIDGFNGAIFERNEILGYVEMQLHGHHHASCFDCHSHNHGDEEKAALHDHTVRYHEADFRDNAITVETGPAFQFTDRAHAGDDRTATSETEETLEDAHEHFTRVAIERNALVGGPLRVDIFNADNARHENEETEEVEAVAVHATHAYRGDLLVRGNVVEYVVPSDPAGARMWLSEPIVGVIVSDLKEARLRIVENEVRLVDGHGESLAGGLPLLGERPLAETPAALVLQDIRSARVLVESNALAGAHTGIRASFFAEDAAWFLAGNLFEDIVRKIETDDSVREA